MTRRAISGNIWPKSNMKVQATTQNKIGQFVWSLARTLLVHKRYVRKLTTLNVPADVLEFNKGMVCEAHNTFFAAKKHFVEDLVKMTYPDFEVLTAYENPTKSKEIG